MRREGALEQDILGDEDEVGDDSRGVRVSRRLFVIDRPVIHRPVVHVGVLHVAAFRVTTGRRRFVGLKIYDTRHTLFYCNIVNTKRYVISRNLNKNSKKKRICLRSDTHYRSDTLILVWAARVGNTLRVVAYNYYRLADVQVLERTCDDDYKIVTCYY